MTDQPENLVLAMLREIRGEIALVRETQAEHTTRLGRLEIGTARLEQTLADTRINVAEMSVRVDRVVSRLERIEKRLGLIEA